MSTAPYELVMYSRAMSCPFVALAKRVLDSEHIHYRELYIDQNKTHEERVLTWTGFLSVPTIIVAQPGEELPISEPSPLAKDASPRGIDRGTMITEPSEDQLRVWLRGHGFLE